MRRLTAIGMATVLAVVSCALPALRTEAEGEVQALSEQSIDETDFDIFENMDGLAEEDETNVSGEAEVRDIAENNDESTADGGLIGPDAAEEIEDVTETGDIELMDDEPGNSENIDDTGNPDDPDEPVEEQPLTVTCRVRMKTTGWLDTVEEGVTAGTAGEGQIERLLINLVKPEVFDIAGRLEYSTYVDTKDWMAYVKAGKCAGVVGKRMEAVKIRLTGDLADSYDVYYRVKVSGKAWLGWAKNDEIAGSKGLEKSMEAIQVRLVKKGDEAPAQTKVSFTHKRVSYQVYQDDYEWRASKVDNAACGTTKKEKRLEAVKINLLDQEYEGSVRYRVFVQKSGWQTWRKDGEVAGTTGKNKRIEAVKIQLTDEMAEHYSIYYKVYIAGIGWSGYAKDGEIAGSSSLLKQIESIKVKLVRNNETAPSSSARRYIKGLTTKTFYYRGISHDKGLSADLTSGKILGKKGIRLESLCIVADNSGEFAPTGTVKYRTYGSSGKWRGWSVSGKTNGNTAGKYGIECVQIKLKGELADLYDIYYRSYIEDYGWMGWAMNGQKSGTTGTGFELQRLQIKLVLKGQKAPGANKNYYSTELRLYQNPSGYYQIKSKITIPDGGYTLYYGCEGIKVRKVIQKLGLGSGIGMGGAFYGSSVQSAVEAFQERKGLPVTGKVDLITWLRLGFTQTQWTSYGAYVSPVRTNSRSTRSECIEAMIDRAYDYLGDDYVIGASGAPGLGIDCSGLVMQGLYAAGLDIEGINPVSHAQPGHEYESRNMWASSKFLHVPYSERQRGDLIFYQGSGGIVIHVAIYLGNNQVIESWPNQVVVWPIIVDARPNVKGVIRPFQ